MRLELRQEVKSTVSPSPGVRPDLNQEQTVEMALDRMESRRRYMECVMDYHSWKDRFIPDPYEVNEDGLEPGLSELLFDSSQGGRVYNIYTHDGRIKNSPW